MTPGKGVDSWLILDMSIQRINIWLNNPIFLKITYFEQKCLSPFYIFIYIFKKNVICTKE